MIKKWSLKALFRESMITLYLFMGGGCWGRYLLRKKATILIYHEISPDLLDEHLSYLKKAFGVVPLGRFIKYQRNKASFPSGKIAITFDDGWKSNYELLEVFKKHDVSVTIFLLSEMFDTNRRIWNYPLREVRPDLNENFKNLPHRDRLSRLAGLVGYYPEKEYPERSFLSRDEISEMLRCVDFQSHGTFHPVLNTCNDDDLWGDLSPAREKIANLTGREVNCLAYPYGRGRVGQREASLARKAGYSIGRVANLPRMISESDDPLLLASLNVPEKASVKELKRILAWGQIATLVRFKH